jgi:hypothetical protein
VAVSQQPAAMPVLSRGRYRGPVRGACFLEYTALLAGEPFSDHPACVDGELAAVLRHANDRLSDGDRFRLTPLLGRAIGLVVPGPSGPPRRPRRSGRRQGGVDGQAAALHDAAVGELRALVSRRFTAALGLHPSPAEWRGHACGRDVDRLLWSLMPEPTPVSTSAAYVDPPGRPARPAARPAARVLRAGVRASGTRRPAGGTDGRGPVGA